MLSFMEYIDQFSRIVAVGFTYCIDLGSDITWQFYIWHKIQF